MLSLALKGLLARKLRTALTGFAVVLGVAFVAGTFVFTDTIDNSFKDLFERVSKGVDISVKARKAVDSDFTPAQPLPASVLERVKATDGVAVAEGTIDSEAALFDRAGKLIGAHSGPSILVSARSEDRFNALSYEAGEAPAAPDEVALDKATADKHGFAVGDRIKVAGRAPARAYRISGLTTLAGVKSIGGTSVVAMTLPEAQRAAGLEGRFDEVVAAADGGTTPEQLKAALAPELGRGVQVLTGSEQAEQQTNDVGDALGFIKVALLVFAGVALLVGGFLIFNTFSVTVAQRTREFALLRTLGASRAQLLRSVVAETVVIGLVASALGVLAGLALAPALRELMAAFGLDLPDSGTVIRPRTVIAGFLVGTIATVVSGFIPARRATRVEAVAAMREGATPGASRVRRGRVVAALALLAAGLGVLLFGLFGDVGSSSATATALGIGAVAMMFGVALVAPVLVRPLAHVVGRPLERMQGLPGRLARENAERQPQRTAITASALMVGLALVVFVTIFAAGLRASVDRVLDEQVRASLLVMHENGWSPIPTGAAQRLGSVEGVTTVSALRFETAAVTGVGTTPATGVDPGTVTGLLKLKWKDGSDATLAGLGERQAVADAGWASKHGFRVGGSVRLTTPSGERLAYELAGTFDNKVGLTGEIIVASDSMRRDWGSRDDAFVLVGAAPGTDPDALQRRAKAALGAFPAAKALTIAAYKDQQADQVNQILGLVFALLSLSVIVALLGIVNTLALSVHERTRELGMLRAVGMSRRQVRRMIRSEAVITAAIGAALGLALGTAFAAIVSRPLASDGFAFTLPWATLALLAVLAALAGVVAAIPPARRAARVDVLRAVTTE